MLDQSCEKRGWLIKNGVQALDLSSLPRCQAVAASTGQSCKRPALKGRNVCGIHAGNYTPGAKKGNRNSLQRGLHTREAVKERVEIRRTLDLLKYLTGALNSQAGIVPITYNEHMEVSK